MSCDYYYAEECEDEYEDEDMMGIVGLDEDNCTFLSIETETETETESNQLKPIKKTNELRKEAKKDVKLN